MDQRHTELMERQRIDRFLQNMFEVVNQFGNIKRYSRDHLIKPENDLEHTGFMVIWALFVGRKLQQSGVGVNMEVLLTRATVHDLEESLTGDIARPTKHANARVSAAFKEVELASVAHLETFLGVDFAYDWESAKSNDLEGWIIKLGDMAAVVYKTMIEVSMYGNKGFMRVAEEVSVELLKLTSFLKQNGFQELHWIPEELTGILQRVERGSIQHGGFFRAFGEHRYG